MKIKNILSIGLCLFLIFPSTISMPIKTNAETIQAEDDYKDYAVRYTNYGLKEYHFGDFEDGTAQGWKAHTGSTNVKVVQSASLEDLPPTEAHKGDGVLAGKYFLEYQGNAGIATNPRSIKKRFHNPVDLTEFRTISFSFCHWVGAATQHMITFIYHFENGQFLRIPVPGESRNVWSTFKVPIWQYMRDEDGREIYDDNWIRLEELIDDRLDRVTAFEIEFRGLDTHLFAGDWSGYMFIDNIIAIYDINYYYGYGSGDFYVEKGDVNFDGQVDIKDIIELRNYIFNKTYLFSCNLAMGDIDENSIINIKDIIGIRNHIFNKRFLE